MEDMKEVCVLYGGNSSEREVSLKSGKFIHKSLVKNGCKSHLIDYADLTELEKLKDFNLVFIPLILVTQLNPRTDIFILTFLVTELKSFTD